MAQKPRVGLSNDELLTKLESWLVGRAVPPSIFEVLKTRDADLFAGFILKTFRAASRQAVLSRIQLYAGFGPIEQNQDGPGAVSTLIEQISLEWSLDDQEQRALLNLESVADLRAVLASSDTDVPIEIIERTCCLLEIYIAINALLPNAVRAANWVRATNEAPLMGGRTALEVMAESLHHMRLVRAYLQSQAWGP